mmetsp:Transcript_87294/g.252071  ORF Transcript_87294/g.252071 Transcript_87294/m.252071 type:complete len:223 (-) Transcript_87294:36-704(-)
MARQQPEERNAQVVHILDILALRVPALVAGSMVAQHGLDRLQHLAVVHNEPAVLHRELHHVADLAQRATTKEVQVPRKELLRASITAARHAHHLLPETFQVCLKCLPHRLRIGVQGAVHVDEHPRRQCVTARFTQERAPVVVSLDDLEAAVLPALFLKIGDVDVHIDTPLGHCPLHQALANQSAIGADALGVQGLHSHVYLERVHDGPPSRLHRPWAFEADT